MIPNDPKLDKAINEKDISLVRTILINQIDTDINREKFLSKELSNMAASELNSLGIALFEEDNREYEFLSADKWDKNQWQTLKVEMRYNFSREKFNFILEMMKFLRKKGNSYFQVKKTNFTKNESSISNVKEEQSIKSSNNNSCGGGVVGGTATGLLTGFVVAKTLTTSKAILGISTVIGGGIGCLFGIICFTKSIGGKK